MNGQKIASTILSFIFLFERCDRIHDSRSSLPHISNAVPEKETQKTAVNFYILSAGQFLTRRNSSPNPADFQHAIWN